MVVLDLRPIAPFERHPKIFSAFDGLALGEALRIINDHDPKPLYYQFCAERSGEFEWEYVKNGPVDWEVEVKKVQADCCS